MKTTFVAVVKDPQSPSGYMDRRLTFPNVNDASSCIEAWLKSNCAVLAPVNGGEIEISVSVKMVR